MRNHAFRCSRTLGAALCLLLAGQAAAQPAPAQPAPAQAAARQPLSQSLTGEARADYETGKVLFNDGDFEGAAVKFRRAYDLSSDPRLLWNAAACEKNLRRYARMLALLERYREEADSMLTEAERQAAAELSSTVRKLVSALDVKVDPPGAAIFVDDTRVGTAPLSAPVLVDMGARRIRVAKPGFKDHVETREIAGASNITISVRLAREVQKGRLVVEAGAEDVIAIDGRPVAQGRWSGALPSGTHAVRVTAPGKLAYQAEVAVQDEKTRRLTVALEPAPDGGFNTTWLWIGGGALAVAGAAIGGYFLFRPEDPAPTPGAMGTVQLSARRAGVRLEVMP